MEPSAHQRRFDACRVHNNRHGFRGVEWDRHRQMFRAYIWPVAGDRGRYLGRFGTAEQAARAYDEAARLAYGVSARLNFPGPDELATEATRRDEGCCPKGHDLGVYGYARPDGRGVNCRECNAAASRRSYAKKAAAAVLALTHSRSRTVTAKKQAVEVRGTLAAPIIVIRKRQCAGWIGTFDDGSIRIGVTKDTEAETGAALDAAVIRWREISLLPLARPEDS